MTNPPDKKQGEGPEDNQRDGDNNYAGDDFDKPDLRKLLIQNIEKEGEGSPINTARLFFQSAAENPPHENLRALYANIIFTGEQEWDEIISTCKSEGAAAAMTDIFLHYKSEKTDLAETFRTMMGLILNCQEADIKGYDVKTAKRVMNIDDDAVVSTSMIVEANDGVNKSRKIPISKISPYRVIDLNVITDPVLKDNVKAAAKRHHYRMREVLLGLSEVFYADKAINIDGVNVELGSPMKFKEAVVIPVYINDSEVKRLVFAYYSEANASWRRLSGSIINRDHAHFQELDRNIQKSLNEIMASKQPIDMADNDCVSGIRDLAPNPSDGEEYGTLTFLQEKQIRETMNFKELTIDLKKRGNQPEELIDFWISEMENRLHGKTITAVISSKNHKHNYVIAISKKGIFLQQVCISDSCGVNIGGSPSIGVTPVEGQKWMMGPVTDKTLVGKNGEEIKMLTHASPDSPFFYISNGFGEVCMALARGDADSAMSIMKQIYTSEKPLNSKTSPFTPKLPKYKEGGGAPGEETVKCGSCATLYPSYYMFCSVCGEENPTHTKKQIKETRDKTGETIDPKAEALRKAEADARAEAEKRGFTEEQWLYLNKVFEFDGENVIVRETDVDLENYTDLVALPKNLKVKGNLNLKGCTELLSLPENLEVGEDLHIEGCTQLTSLPKSLKVGGLIYVSDDMHDDVKRDAAERNGEKGKAKVTGHKIYGDMVKRAEQVKREREERARQQQKERERQERAEKERIEKEERERKERAKTEYKETGETTEPVAPKDWRQAYYGRKFGIKPEEPKKPEYTSSINCPYEPYRVKTGENMRIEFILGGIKLTIENGATVTIGKAFPGAIIECLGPKASYRIEEKIGDHDKDPVRVISK